MRTTRYLHASRYLIPLALVGVALAVRIYRLDAQSLWLDEGSSWQMSSQSWGTLLGDLLSPTAAYPLYHLLLKLWISLFGDSEIALRLPSAIAGAMAVPVIYLAAQEGSRESESLLPPLLYPLTAALIALIGPFPLWYAQEAKAYSLLLLAAALLTWTLLRALRTGSHRDWLAFAVVALIAVCIHRLAALSVVAGGWAWWGGGQGAGGRRREAGGEGSGVEGRGWRVGQEVEGREPASCLLPPASCLLPPASRLLLPASWAATGLILMSAGLVAVMVYGLGSDRAATGAYIPAGPLAALGLTFTRFSLDRWPGDVPWWWLLPWAILLVWGLIRLSLDVWRKEKIRSAPLAILCLLLVPLGLFVIQLLFTHLYEARYLIVIYPVWTLVVAYPLAGGGRREAGGGRREAGGRGRGGALIMVLAALGTGGAALFQPTFGLFSGAPVKEQYREAIAELAARIHPDDAVVIHPAYIRPLYDYYMRRLSADPAPPPLVFADFWQGKTTYGQREWDIERHQKLAGYTRSFLLIAPEHAKTVDAPAPGTGDEYGLVGNFWAFSREQRTWPCGIWRYNGAHLLCQEAPETYITGEQPQPTTRMNVRFEDTLTLLGYTLKASAPGGPGVYRAGGNLPISLFWAVDQQPTKDLSFFLHLCQDCTAPPLASDDGPPLEGYLPTSNWFPRHPARDDRAIHLPQNLPPGRYTLLLGVYRPANPAPSARLAVHGGEVLSAGRLVLGTVDIVSGE